MVLKNKIREKRVALGFTQQQFADLVQTSKNTISNIERGIYNPTAFLAAKICYALCCKFEDVFWIDLLDDYDLDPEQANMEFEWTLFDGYLQQRDK